MRIREWVPGEEVAPVTEMLHRAYAELAAMGFRYLATHQDDAITRSRLEEGIAFVAEREGRIVGTISLCPWTAMTDPAEAYRRPGLWVFHQFGVEPSCQRGGIGSALLDAVEQRAREEGATELGCDTAEGATHLIRLYERRGFTIVGSADFDVTNYESVVLVKPLR